MVSGGNQLRLTPLMRSVSAARRLLTNEPIGDHVSFTLDCNLASLFDNIPAQSIKQLFTLFGTVNLQRCKCNKQLNVIPLSFDLKLEFRFMMHLHRVY